MQMQQDEARRAHGEDRRDNSFDRFAQQVPPRPRKYRGGDACLLFGQMDHQSAALSSADEVDIDRYFF